MSYVTERLSLSNNDELDRERTRSLKDIESFGWIILLVIAAAIGVFSISVGLSATTTTAGLVIGIRALCVAAIVAVAAACVGGLLGFLFGIPKLLQGPLPASEKTGETGAANIAPMPRRFLGTNTSLEEISDWLTKIIIGLGLVQFQLVISYVHKAAIYSASYIQQQPIKYDDKQVILEGDGSIATAVLFALVIGCALTACLFVCVSGYAHQACPPFLSCRRRS
jgi:hypothetical protein